MERKVYGDYPDSLSPSLWSSLPLELLTMIITQTTDMNTLDNWCEATQKNRHLYETAMMARWRIVIIDDRDLLPAPGDDKIRFDENQERMQKYNLGQHWKPVGEFVNTLLSTINNESGRCRANYIQGLVFDFRLLRYWEDNMQDYWEPIGEYSEEDLEDIEDTEVPGLSAHDLVPSVESLKYTLTKLQGHLHNLRYLSCYGDTPEAILDFAANQDAVNMRSLDIRSLGAYSRLHIDFKDEPYYSGHPLRRWPLLFENLSVLSHLKTLNIHRLSNHETTSLLNLLPKLIDLRCLILACEAEEHNDYYGGCALKSLFDQIFQNRDTHWFPRNLKSLSLIDTNHYSK
jgi:hypothetical protein